MNLLSNNGIHGSRNIFFAVGRCVPGEIMNNSFCRRLALAMTLAFFVQLQWNSHAAEKDGGFVIYPGPQAGPVVFSHSAHGKENAGYRCDKCHAAGSVKTLHITMEDIRQGKICGSCHNGSTKGIRGQRAASPIEECGACHMPASDIVFRLNRMDPVKFSHVKHLSAETGRKVSNQMGFSCRDCHPTPFDRVSKGSFEMEAPHESGGCAQCHHGQKRNGRTAFAATTRCLTCHRNSDLPAAGQP
jgi:c(7)-type cytochrome triheme protein